MSKRVHLTISDTTYRDLERLAEARGRPLASLAGFLLENAVAELASKMPEPSTIQGIIQLCLSRIQSPDPLAAFCEAIQLEKPEVDMILQGRQPTDGQILAIATAANMSVRDLDILVKQQYGNSKSN